MANSPQPLPEKCNLRVPFNVTASELQAIDDWMFRHRIRNRASAIRRLIEIGLSPAKTITGEA